MVKTALALRRERPAAFVGDYLPLAVSGERSAHAFAFARGGEAVTVVPRFPLLLRGDWAETSVALPRGRWLDRFTGTSFEGGEALVEDLLAGFPVALLSRKS